MKTAVNRRLLHILLVEDRLVDEQILHELERAGFDPDWRRVENEIKYDWNARAIGSSSRRCPTRL